MRYRKRKKNPFGINPLIDLTITAVMANEIVKNGKAVSTMDQIIQLMNKPIDQKQKEGFILLLRKYENDPLLAATKICDHLNIEYKGNRFAIAAIIDKVR